MNILHINFSFTIGGIDLMLIDIINEQCKYENVDLFIINNHYDQDLFHQIDPKVKIYFLNRPKSSKNLIYILTLNRLIFKNKYDIIHCHNSGIISILFPFIKSKKVLTVHAINLPVKYYNKYDRIFSISSSVKSDIYQKANIDSTVIYNGIDFKNIIEKEKYSYNKFNLIQISRLDHLKKGQHILIDAVNILKEEYLVDNIQLDIIGIGSSFEILKKQIEKLKLENNIRFLGIKDRNYIYQNLNKYDLLVQPSLYEGFGLTIVESIGALLPVLASNIDGPKEISKLLNYDFLVESGSSKKLAAAILKIFKNKNDSQFQKKIIEAKEKAIKLFSIELTATNYLKEYYKMKG